MVENSLTEHPDCEPDFRMSIVGVYRRPLQRQTKEGQLIEDFKGGNLLNRRGEWGQNLPPKFEIVTEQYTNGKKRANKEEERASNPDSDSDRRQATKRIRVKDRL